VGEPLTGLHTAVQDDPAFWELLETPLMLWIATLAYKDKPSVSIHAESLEQRRHNLFAHFVEVMFQRKPLERRYTKEQALSWVSYLALTLATKGQTLFYLENLDLK
jgi:hypothetical protein